MTKFAVAFLALVWVGAEAGAADWPCFRGPNRNGQLNEQLELLPAPSKLWETVVGSGNAALSVAGGRLYTLARQPENSVVCLDARTGERLWMTPVKTWFRDATPAIDAGRVYALTAEKIPRLYCLAAASGEILWERELPKSTGERHYGHSGSPVIWQDLVLLNAGGGVALKKIGGEIAWSQDGFPGLAAPVIFSWKGRTCVALFGGDALVARDATTGRELFRIPWKTDLAVNACDPIVLGERIFLCSDYGLGRALYDFSQGTPKLVWEMGQRAGHAYSSGFASGGDIYFFSADKFICLDPTTGQARWEENGTGTALFIGDKLIRLRSRGELEVARISPAGYAPLLEANVEMTEIKNAPSYADGRLYIRNEKGYVACWEIGRSKAAARR